jgi:hypothetical protein
MAGTSPKRSRTRAIWRNRLRELMRPAALLIAAIATFQLVMISRNRDALHFFGGWIGLILMIAWDYSIAAALYVGYGVMIRRARLRGTLG